MSTTEKWRLLLGLSIVMVLAFLAAMIALGHVEEKTSFGLMPMVVALSNVAVLFAQWAFGSHNSNNSDKQG